MPALLLPLTFPPVAFLRRPPPRSPHVSLSPVALVRTAIAAACLFAGTGQRCAAADWTPQFTGTATWHDNATNANRDSDILGALALTTGTTVARRVSLSRADALLYGGHLAAAVWPRFDGLDVVTFGAHTAWQHKFGLGAAAPVVSVELSADAIAARESPRSGFAGGLTLACRRRLGEATLIVASQEFSRLDARAAVFDRTAAETTLSLLQTLNETWSLGATVRLRHGDVLSYATPPRPDLVALARTRTSVDTFGRPMVAYSIDARTLSGALMLTRTLGERTSLSAAAEVRETEDATLRYLNHLVSLSLVHSF